MIVQSHTSVYTTTLPPGPGDDEIDLAGSAFGRCPVLAIIVLGEWDWCPKFIGQFDELSMASKIKVFRAIPRRKPNQ